MAEKVLYTLFVLVIAVTIHEFGHYIAGRVFHVRMKSFNIFWGPGFKLFSSHSTWFLRLFPACKDKIEVTIGWLPIFAYVLFDDTGDGKEDRQCLWLKPAWQRCIIYFAGVLLNLLTVFAVHTTLLCHLMKNPTPTKVVAYAAKFTCRDTQRMTTYISRSISTTCQRICGIDVPPSRIERAAQKSGKGTYYTMASRIHANWNPYSFLRLLVSMSVALFIINLIPIPPLDGGNILYCIFEMITGIRPSMKLQTWVGTTVFIIYILYTIYDVTKEIILDVF